MFNLKNWRVMKVKLKRQIMGMLVLVLVFILGACSSSDVSEGAAEGKSGGTLRIGYINSTGAKEGESPPIGGGEGWAIHNGLLQENLKEIGISNFEYYAFPNGPDLNEAIAAKEIDVGLLGDTPGILAKSTGYETTLIGLSGVNTNVWLVSNKKEVITDLQQLEGKIVGTAKGSYMYRYLLGLLKENGLEDSVQLVHMLPPDAQTSLENGDIAAFAAPTYTGPRLVKNGFQVIQEATIDSPHLAGTSVTIARTAFLEENPEFSAVWAETRTESVKDLKENLDAYYAYYSEVSKQELDVVKASSPLETFNEESFPEDGLKLLEGTKDFLFEAELIRTDFEIEDWRNGK